MKNNITAIGEILYDVYPDKKRLGGAPFNFIYHIWKILGKANFISSVGNDGNGNEIISNLNSIGFPTNYIIVDKIHPTGTVQVKINADKIPHFTISPECSYDFILLDDNSKNLVENNTDLLYFGTLTMRDEISRNSILSLFNNPDKKYFCDLNLRHDFFSKELIEKILSTCNVIKINQDELNKLKSIFNLSSDNKEALLSLIGLFNIEMAAVTLGENGAELYRNGEVSFCKLPAKNIVDTLGAGDAFSAILCLGYLKNIPPGQINKLANDFALQVCQINGALPIDDSVYNPYRKFFAGV